jgi:long-chain-fatty-acid--CoA ligase ACSBG
MMDLFGPLYIGGQTWFAQPDALKGSLANTLKEVRPTYFMGVPRVWEKIADRVQARAKMFGVIKSKLFSWARGKALKGNLNIERGGSVPFGYSVANSLLLSKARSEMGLDRCRYCFTGAAPIGRETTMFFLSVGLPLLEIYGMSECSGPATMARPWLRRTGSSGRVYDGVEMKLNNMDSDGNGEVIMCLSVCLFIFCLFIVCPHVSFTNLLVLSSCASGDDMFSWVIGAWKSRLARHLMKKGGFTRETLEK